MRLSMLRRQVLMVSDFRADLGREWANELFTLSFQAKEGHRAVAQETAMSVLIRLDPDRALELLHSICASLGCICAFHYRYPLEFQWQVRIH
jgi:hypothetical protein